VLALSFSGFGPEADLVLDHRLGPCGRHLFLLLAFMKAFQDRRAPWYQRGLIRKPLRKIGLILLHDVEHSFLGELAMVLGK
jgi:hypothetical protein